MEWEFVWQFQTANFRIMWDIAPEQEPDFSFDDTGETAEKVASGVWTCFTSRVTVLYLPTLQTLGVSYLGNSIYENPRDFRKSGYLLDMVREACAESRRMLANLHSIHIRKGA